MSVKTSFQKEILRYWHATFSGKWAIPLHTWVLTGLSGLKKLKNIKIRTCRWIGVAFWEELEGLICSKYTVFMCETAKEEKWTKKRHAENMFSFIKWVSRSTLRHTLHCSCCLQGLYPFGHCLH